MLNNKLQIIGNVGRTPEVFVGDTGKKILTFSVCVNEKFKKNDEWVERSTWFPCICFQANRIEYLEKYLRSGSYIMAEGRVTENKYTSKKYFDVNGKPATIREHQLVIEDFLLLDKRQHQDAAAAENIPEHAPVEDLDDEVPY